MPKNRSKQSDLIDFILPERQILLLFSIGIFRNYAYHKIKKKRRFGAFFFSAVIIYSTCTDAVLVVPLGTSAPETITTTSPF